MESRACTPGIMYIILLPLMFYSGLTFCCLLELSGTGDFFLHGFSHAPVLINNDF
jgi:hypothetical protein